MKWKICLTLAIMLVPLSATLNAQAQQKSLSSTMNIYVFPKNGQEAPQQSKDEASCYDWAVQNTGTDPFELREQTDQKMAQAQQQEQQSKEATKGAGAQGAVKGAAAGALIGAIAGDTGKGAAYGAAAGVIGGRTKARHSRKDAEKQAVQQEQSVQQSAEAQMGNFKKAFSVCLEAKDYMVK